MLDGLSSLGGYNVKVEHGKLFTRFYVDINQKYVVAAASAAAARHSGKYDVQRHWSLVTVNCNCLDKLLVNLSRVYSLQPVRFTKIDEKFDTI